LARLYTTSPTSRNDYSSWEKEDLIKKIKALERRKKYGLVWDAAKEPEKVVLDCREELPVLKEIKENEIHIGVLPKIRPTPFSCLSPDAAFVQEDY